MVWPGGIRIADLPTALRLAVSIILVDGIRLTLGWVVLHPCSSVRNTLRAPPVSLGGSILICSI